MVSKNSIVPEEMLSSIVLDEKGRPYNGDLLDGKTIYRFRDGILHSEDDAAIDRWPHIECWQNGKLHNTNGPAIYNNDTDFEEFWVNGVQQETGISWAEQRRQAIEKNAQ